MAILKKFLKNKAFYVMFAIVLILAPNALYNQGQTFQTAIVIAMGIDKNSSGIEVSINYVVPQTNGQLGPKYETISKVSNNVSNAIKNIEFNIGKSIGLAHLEAIVINKELFSEDVSKYLDHFYRTNNLTINSRLLATDSLAKDVLKAITTERNNLNLSLRSLAYFTDKHLLNSECNINNFYIDYFSKYNLSYINIVNVKEKENKNAEKEDGKQTEKVIESNGSLLMVKEGRAVKEFKNEELNTLHMISKKAEQGLYEVKNVSANNFKNVDFVLDIASKKVKQSCKFINGVPHFNVFFDLIFKLEEIKANNYKLEDMYGLESYMSLELKNKIKEQISGGVANLMQLSKEKNADVLGICNYIYKHNYKNFINFVKENNIKSVKDLLNKVVVTTSFKIKGKI